MATMDPTPLPTLLPRGSGAEASPPASPTDASDKHHDLSSTEADEELDVVSTPTPPMSDADLDAEFQKVQSSRMNKMKAAPRPTSQLAQSFSRHLDDLFLIDDNLDRLSHNINRKKQSVSYQSSELAALEARIAAAERLLKNRKIEMGLPDDATTQELEKAEAAAEASKPVESVVEATKVPEKVMEEKTVVEEVEEEGDEEEEEEEEGEEEEEEPEPEVVSRAKRRASKYVPGFHNLGHMGHMGHRRTPSDYETKRQFQLRTAPPPPGVPVEF